MVKSVLLVGDKVDIHFDNSPYYRTYIEDVEEDGAILRVSAPMEKERVVPIPANQELTLYFYRENGKFSIQARVMEFRKYSTGTSVMLEVMTESRKDQRREFYRLPSMLTVEARYLPDELIRAMPNALAMLYDVGNYDDAVLALFAAAQYEPNVTARDLSISGLSVRSSKRYKQGDRLALKIYLRWPHGTNVPLLAAAEVKRVQLHSETRKYFVGLEFLGAFSQRELITKYIYEQQRLRIQKQRLIEGT
ncbi:MAG: flagellar brake protein [Oscillospiraceae bacterium]|jgi:c-di-GMP-binding flagellar brake protein YcgR|nr:flagellar brake protein [Oscillospiraceae bacterium]